MPLIKLYEHEPTRSARCRWTLKEAGLEYESIGNAPDIIVSYTANWGKEDKLIGDFVHVQAYLDRLLEREHCTLQRFE